MMPGEWDWMNRNPFLRGSGGFRTPGILAQPTPGIGGILGSGTQPGDPSADARMAFAAQLLAGSGYSPQKRSFGQLVGEAMQAGQQAKAQSQDSAIRKQYMESQMEAMRRPPARKPIAVVGPDGKPVLEDEQNAIGKTPYFTPNQADDGVGNFNPGDYTPDSFAKYMKTGNSTATRDPSVLIRYETPREQNPYFRDVTRVNPDGSTSQGVFDARSGTYSWPNPTVAPGIKARVDAAGKAIGEAEGTAAFDFPRVEGNVKEAIKTLKDLRSSPGLSQITGIYSMVPIVPGTDQAAADALASQVEGQTFLQAYNTLKGGGAITEAEGTKATTAIGRLKRAQSTKAYQAALDDLAGVLERGVERARKQASGATSRPGGSVPETPKYQEGQTATNPKTGQKMIFRGGQWQAQ